jgi:hypothetical protein
MGKEQAQRRKRKDTGYKKRPNHHYRLPTQGDHFFLHKSFSFLALQRASSVKPPSSGISSSRSNTSNTSGPGTFEVVVRAGLERSMVPDSIPVLEARVEETLGAAVMLVLESVRRGTRPIGRVVVDLVVIVVMLEVGREAVVVAVRAAVVEREAVVLPGVADNPEREVGIGFVPVVKADLEAVVVWVADRGLLAVAVGIGFLIV